MLTINKILATMARYDEIDTLIREVVDECNEFRNSCKGPPYYRDIQFMEINQINANRVLIGVRLYAGCGDYDFESFEFPTELLLSTNKRKDVQLYLKSQGDSQ